MRSLSEVDLAPGIHAAACRGDPLARAAVYEAVAGPAFALTCRLVGRGNAEDVFQDAMMRTFERLADFRAEAPFGIWVRAIAVNACLMHLRSPWRRFRSLFEDIGAAFDRTPSFSKSQLSRAHARLRALAGGAPPAPRPTSCSRTLRILP